MLHVTVISNVICGCDLPSGLPSVGSILFLTVSFSGSKSARKSKPNWQNYCFHYSGYDESFLLMSVISEQKILHVQLQIAINEIEFVNQLLLLLYTGFFPNTYRMTNNELLHYV